MTDEQKAAYINAQAVCALAEIQSMVAFNAQRPDHQPPYYEAQFQNVANKYCIHHNAVISFFGE